MTCRLPFLGSGAEPQRGAGQRPAKKILSFSLDSLRVFTVFDRGWQSQVTKAGRHARTPDRTEVPRKLAVMQL